MTRQQISDRLDWLDNYEHCFGWSQKIAEDRTAMRRELLALDQDEREVSKGGEQVNGHIRWMIRRDMEDVLEIEQLCFPQPWRETDFIRVLRQRNAIGLILEVRKSVCGFVIYELHKPRLHLLNLAVHPSCWRRGVGRALVEKLISKLSVQRRDKFTVMVRESNVDAQCFWRAMGCTLIGTMSNEYEETGEDAYLFEYRLRTPVVGEDARFD